jgi:hypothetical protein
MPASKVMIVRAPNPPKRPGDYDPKRSTACSLGLRLLTGQAAPSEAIRSVFPADRVRIKINAIAAPELDRPRGQPPFARLLSGARIPPRNIIIWDRASRTAHRRRLQTQP